jgi:hypothetical protein
MKGSAPANAFLFDSFAFYPHYLGDNFGTYSAKPIRSWLGHAYSSHRNSHFTINSPSVSLHIKTSSPLRLEPIC